MMHFRLFRSTSRRRLWRRFGRNAHLRGNKRWVCDCHVHFHAESEHMLMTPAVCVSVQDDEDVFILSKLSDILHSLFGTYKTELLPVFDKLLPYFVKLLVCTNDVRIGRLWAARLKIMYMYGFIAMLWKMRVQNSAWRVAGRRATLGRQAVVTLYIRRSAWTRRTGKLGKKPLLVVANRGAVFVDLFTQFKINMCSN